MAETALPADLVAEPRLNRWISVAEDGRITLYPGKVEIGQGLLTALTQIAADELDVPPDHILLQPATTGASPDEGVTSGSLSISHCGLAIRQVAAEVRALFLAEAARNLDCDQALITVAAGRFSAEGSLSQNNPSFGYGELAIAVNLDRDADGLARPKSAGARALAGQPFPRLDIAERVMGQRPYIHDLALPEMLHGRVLRGPNPCAVLLEYDEAPMRLRWPAVRVIRNGSFIGVIAASEHDANCAAEMLAKTTAWSDGLPLPDIGSLAVWLRGEPAETEIVDRCGDGADHPLTGRLTRTYLKPFLAHASIAPSCAIAAWHDGGIFVQSHTQGVYNLRADLALVFGLDPERVVVTHRESAGCYGHNGADDVALDAALLAQHVPGQPVRVQWSRKDELTASPLGAAMLVQLSADLGPDGTITGWQHDVWSNGHVARPGRAATPTLLAGYTLAKPFPRLQSTDPPLASGGGSQRNAVPLYAIPNRSIRKHRILTAPLRTSSMRSLGAIGNVFAIESFMDELAAHSGQDALAFRLRHLADERARAVLERVAGLCGWATRTSREGVGLGLAFARYKNTGGYCAVAAEVNVTDEPRATRLWIAADLGEVINPDGAINQIEGGAIQSVSWAMKEEVRFSRHALECGSWDSYPILRFSDVPEVAVALMKRPDEPPLGAGEVAQGPTAAALANAIFAALGIRVRQMPFTRERLLAAME